MSCNYYRGKCLLLNGGNEVGCRWCPVKKAYNKGVRDTKKDGRPQGEWIPIEYRPMTVEERIAFVKYYGVEYCDTLEEKAFNCPMPEDGQEILISTKWGVAEDVADNDVDGEALYSQQ